MSKLAITVEAGFYGLAVGSVIESIDSFGHEPAAQDMLARMLAASEHRIAVFPVSDEEKDLFNVAQLLPDGGIILSLAAHSLRADDPGVAYASVVRETASTPNIPLMVAWIETPDRALMH